MSASAASALNGGGGGGNNSNFLNAKPIPATFKFSSQTGLKLAKFKGTIEPLKYANELFNAIKHKSYEELKDLHARFPLVIAELNRSPSPTLRAAVLIFGHDLLLVLRKVELAHQRGETYPSDPAVSNHQRQIYRTRGIAASQTIGDPKLAQLVNDAESVVYDLLGEAYMKVMRSERKIKNIKAEVNVLTELAGMSAYIPRPVPVKGGYTRKHRKGSHTRRHKRSRRGKTRR